MSTTIDSLDIQISTSAGQSAAKIQAIADALGNLKNQGKIGAATSAMKSLAKALDVLNPSLNALNPAKLQQLRAVIGSLSNIQKASGLNSTVNTLKKIPEVLGSLDDSVLVKLEVQLKRLSRAISPLATEIDKIGNGFAKLPKRVTQVVNATNKMAKASAKAAAATKKHGDAINGTSLNIMSAISNFESMIHVVNIVGNAISSTMAEAMEWDGIQYRFGRAFGEDAEEVYAYAQKINDVLGINMQQFMQYSSLYGSLLSGFGMAQDKVTTISVGLTELSYDIWAAYNDRFKSLEDASEAVRSAITGEIEPIRNAGIALTEASLQEYLDQVGMAAVSIEKLSEAQKAEVRYAAMMNAAMNQGIVGTYASEMQTAEGAVRNLSQSFKTLTQAFGSLFIPLLQMAIPYLTAFVKLLTEAVHGVAEFFGITMFEIDWGNGAENSKQIEESFKGASGAAKKIRDYTMGFDELNIIQPQKDGGTGGSDDSGSGWTGLDLETLWNDSIFANASQQVDELKRKIEGWFDEWETQIAIVGGALGALSMAAVLGHLGEALNLGNGFLGVLGTIKKIASTAIVITLQYSLMSEFFGNFIKNGSWKDYILAMIVGAVGTGILYSMWGPAGLVIGLGVTAVASFKAVLDNGGIDSAESAVTALTGLASAVGAVALAWSKLKNTDVGAFFALLKEGNSVTSVLAATFPKLTSFFTSIGPTIAGAAKAVGAFVGGISAPVWITIVATITAISSVVVFLKRNWEDVTAAVKGFFETNIVPKLESIKKSWEKMKSAVSSILPPGVIQWFKDVGTWIGNIVKKIGEWFKSVDWLEGIGKVFEWLGGIIFSVVGGQIAAVFSSVIQWIQGAIKWFSGIVQVISGFVEFWIALFTGKSLIDPLKKMWGGIKDVFIGMYDMTVGVVVNWVKSIIDWFTELWDELVGHSIVPDMINAIIKWFLSLPGKILGSIKTFANDVIKRFKNLWSELKSWWNTNVAPKFTLAYWKGKFNSITKGLTDKWTEARNWWNNNKPTLANVHATVASVKDKLSSAWTTARNWWNNSKPSLANVHASIASVKEKLSSAWTTARTWWNNSKSRLNTVSVSVSSIKDKLSSAWTTAKDWFNRQSLKLNIKTPHFSVGWNYNISSTMATIADFLFDKRALPKLDVSWYANGGMPPMGEMFVAREAGPELVGRIGSRNAVVNNDQIVAAVSEGVYAAVVAAMKATAGQGNGAQAVNVYLDGKQITSTVEQRQRERGAIIMGSQVYSY